MANKFFIFLLLLLCTSATYADVSKANFSIGLSYDHTDNVFLSKNFVKPENIFHALFSAYYEKKSSTLDLDFNLNIDRQQYLEYSYFDNTVGSSSLKLSDMLRKDRIYWELDNRFDKVPNEFNSPNVPTNYQNVNYFLTGPIINIVKDARNTLSASAKYQNFYTQKTLSDYDGYIANIIYTRKVTRTFSAGLSLKYNDVNYKYPGQLSGYTLTDTSITLDKSLKHSQIIFEAGRSDTRPVISNEHSDFYKLRFTSQLSKQLNMEINYRRGLSDFSNVFSGSAQQNENLPDLGGTIFLLETGSIIIEKQFGFSELQINYSYFKNEYPDELRNLKSNYSSVSYTNHLSEATDLTLGYSYRHTDYVANNRKEIEKLYTASIVRKFSNIYSIGAKAYYLNRDSSDVFSGYTERRISANVYYYFR